MAITVLLRAQAKPRQSELFKHLLESLLPETRRFEGFIHIAILEANRSVGSFVFYEQWETIEAYEYYLSYRTEQGVMDKIAALLVDAPDITYYNDLQI